jgi:hypothetical protein
LPELRPDHKHTSIGRYIPATILVPLLGASLGIDGGPIFQILAVENLGLSAAAIGLAFGFGVISLPIQLWAARLPIELARRNVQIFLVVAAVQAWVLAALGGFGFTGRWAAIALGVTITAEILLSVLYATSWQPLLASSLGTRARQRLNSTWSAIARAVLAGALGLFALLGDRGRSVFLLLVGAASVAVAIGLKAVDAPRPAPHGAGTATVSEKSATAMAPAMRVVLVVFAAINIGAVPLWLVYLSKVLWPSVNLGAIAAVQTLASMAALLAWRSTDGDVTRRALLAAVAALVAAVCIAPLDTPVSSNVHQTILVVATAIMAAATTTVRIAMLEAAHRVVKPGNTVRSFTLLDVVASTSLQAGLLLSGFLITASATNGDWLTDPYRAFVALTTATAIPAILWLRTHASGSGSTTGSL